MPTEIDNDAQKLELDLKLEERKFLFEQRKYEDDLRANERKLALQEKELSQKRSDPLIIVVIGGVIAALANAGVSYYNGTQQIELETTKHANELDSEKYKTEALRISDASKSADQVQNACRLNFLLDFDLITNEILRTRVNKFLREKKAPEVAGIEPTNATETYKNGEYTSICTIETTSLAANNPVSVDYKPVTYTKDINSQPTEKKPIQSLTFSTGWISGGHSQSEACSQAVALYQPQFPGKSLESAGASEDSRKDILGHVTYNYRCTINVFDSPSAERLSK
ncbi:hypothetical protein [Agrobacterium vitis]|uniref:hypothetical protein n=1 Tax=Agrobacterium vitis TaxID=373 RepID=UPI0012E8D522|nr:hypothetical protein [Agrobacterium vitis]MVA60609.1 hypothetical protein [Agrobacterium vitis]